MYDEAKQLEGVRILDRIGGRRRGPVRMADPGCNTDLQPNDHTAAAGAASNPVSHRLGDPLWPDGLQRRKDLAFTAVGTEKPGAEFVCGPAHREFFLEPHFLSGPGLWICLPLADIAVGAGVWDDPSVLPGGSLGCLAADPLPGVADLCGLFEFGGVDPERIGGKL